VVEQTPQLVGIEEPDATGREKSLKSVPTGGSSAKDAHDGEATPYSNVILRCGVPF
jgi:hypothetical protein